MSQEVAGFPCCDLRSAELPLTNPSKPCEKMPSALPYYGKADIIGQGLSLDSAVVLARTLWWDCYPSPDQAQRRPPFSGPLQLLADALSSPPPL